MSRNITINGVHLVLLGISGNAGDKNGVGTIHVPVNIEDLKDVFAVSAGDVAKEIGLGDVMCTSRPFSQLEHGGYQVNFEFEGFQSKATYEQQKNAVTVRFTPEERQDPIQTHPAFLGAAGLGKKWGYDETTEKFRKNVSSASTDQGGLDKTLAAGDNPLFGVESWINFGGTFTRSYAVTEPPSDLWDKVGMLIDAPPDADKIRLKKFKNRKWLKCSPEIESGDQGSGSAIRISERYKLTGILRGKPNAADLIYAIAQLQ